MAKQIVSINEIPNDNALKVIKAFRIANKRCGECKRLFNSESASPEDRDRAATEYRNWSVELRGLRQKANNLDFEIWVNHNGKTGHTYGKDYKLTPDADNDIERHILENSGRNTRVREAVQETLDNVPMEEPETPDEEEHLLLDEEDFDEGEE